MSSITMILDKANILDTHDAAAGAGSQGSFDTTGMAVLAQAVAPLDKLERGSQVTSSSPSSSAGKAPHAYPFFHYKDHSKDVDPDPLYPLVPPGRVPNFPAKMHAILSRTDLQDIITWLPHGRSWQVLKPRDFETKVIPQYFELTRFSSFVRQANGWGFRRITQGRGQNSYYHPKFLRGLPFLCKTMKRQCGKGQKKKGPILQEEEPDLFKISELCPLPETTSDDAIMLACTMQGGPKARMPVFCGIQNGSGDMAVMQLAASQVPYAQPRLVGSSAPEAVPQTESSAATVSTFSSAAGGQGAFSSVSSDDSVRPSSPSDAEVASLTSVTPQVYQMPTSVVKPGEHPTAMMPVPFNALFMPQMMQMSGGGGMMMMMPGHGQDPNQNSAAASSSFAAGFAAATAFSQQQMSMMFQHFSGPGAMKAPFNGPTP